MVGFGTQFIDVELDGRLDLIVTNGHVDDLSIRGRPFRMRPQLFRNVGEGRFVEERSPSLGPFFEEKHLGRGLARLDWNRDGREDVLISHLDTPVALLSNQTSDVGHFLAVQLRGVTRSRDAIGTVVRVTTGQRSFTQQLTAGDGYQSSNQRQLVFGLGAAEQVETLSVKWPSGETQQFDRIPIDCELLFVEGQAKPIQLP